MERAPRPRADVGGKARSPRWASVLIALAVGLAVLAPMILGPALAPLAAALGAEAGHRCACGMTPGTCGCPDCERIERRLAQDRGDVPYRIFRAQCEGGEVAPGFAAVPPAVLAPAAIRVARAGSWTAILPPSQASPSLDPAEPATPPPRVAIAS